MAHRRRPGFGRAASAFLPLACWALRRAEAAWDHEAFDSQLQAWAAAWEAAEAERPAEGVGSAAAAAAESFEEELPPARAEVAAAVRSAVSSVDLKTAVQLAGWAADAPRSARGGTHAVAAVLAEAVALLPGCLEDLRTLAETQTRCSQKWYKIAIQKLLSIDDRAAAERAWRRATSIQRGGSGVAQGLEEAAQAMPWPSVLETPTMWVRNLSSQPFWDCHSSWPFVRTLEANVARILSEAHSAAPKLTAAYPYLFTKGTWQNFFLYRGQKWNDEVCAAMPRTCNLLIPEMPSKPLPVLLKNNEEIVLFKSEPGAFVGPHSGAVNNQINIHLTLKGGEGVFLKVGEEVRELSVGKALCFQDSYVHSVEHTCQAEKCAERISLVIRVFHPDFTRAHYGDAVRTDAVEDLAAWHEGHAANELDRLKEQYRRLADLHEEFRYRVEADEQPCAAPEPTEAELAKARRLFAFLSTPFGPLAGVGGPARLGLEEAAQDTEQVDAIVVLSNWYDRLTKVQRVLELATRYSSAPIVIIGGRGRLSSIRAAELDGEAHATLARLLVLLEIPGELGTISTDRAVAISCNECPTPELRQRCGCVGNTGFNTDRFLDWAAVHLPPLPDRRRRVVFVEESYLVRRVVATVLGRLGGGFDHRHNLPTMEVSVVDARGSPGEEGLRQVMDAHSEMPGGVLHLMAGEVLRLEEYSRERPIEPGPESGAVALFPRASFLGEEVLATMSALGSDGLNGTELPAEVQTSPDEARSAGAQVMEHWAALLAIARQLDGQWDEPMARVSRDRRIFWRCVAPRDSESPLWAREISEAPGEAWRYWKCPRGKRCAA